METIGMMGIYRIYMAWFGLSLHPVEAGVPALRHRRKTASGCFDGIHYSPL